MNEPFSELPSHDSMEVPSKQPLDNLVYPIIGMHWKATIKGKDSLNGAVYTRILGGRIPDNNCDDFYEVASGLAKAIKQFHPNMKHVCSIQFTLGIPE